MNPINKELIKLVLIFLTICLLLLFLIIKANAQTVNPCSSCELDIPIGFVLKITTLKASDKSTLERWVNDFINSHKVIKIDKSKFPKSVMLYHIDKDKNR